MTPMATPAVAMCMGEGGYDLKALFKSGWLICILLAIVNVVLHHDCISCILILRGDLDAISLADKFL